MTDHTITSRPRVVILVVEDEPIQRMDLIDMVEEAGFEAAEAWDADEAIRILETRTDIRVVLTDIDMPGSIDGMRLAACIRDRWPPIEIIVTTAGVPPDAKLLPARTVFLPKPIRHTDAVGALQAFAASSGASQGGHAPPR